MIHIKKDLAFSIDGIDSSNNDITLSGSTDQRGHRILRGLTLLKGNSSAINYDTSINNSDKVLNVYGGTYINSCTSGKTAHLDISGVDSCLNIIQNGEKNIVLFGNGDASFNSNLTVGNTITAYNNLFVDGNIDISENLTLSGDLL